MSSTTPDNTARDSAVQDRARGADLVLPPENVPSTIAIAGSVGDPKIPTFVGDSWRPAVAGLLGAVPLAVATAAMAGASLLGSTAASSHAVAATGEECVTTVTAGALGQLKWPDCGGD